MKTIGFTSYKGGTGKTLMAANFALFLSRLGKNCVLLDMDFDGPSLHDKFTHSSNATGKGGFLQFFMSGVEGDSWKGKEGKNTNPKFPWGFKELDRLEYYVDPFKALEDDADNKLGTIHFLPVADILKAKTLQTLYSPFWRRMFSIAIEFRWGLLTSSDVEPCIKQLQRAKENIAKLDPAPDYFIIDFRSGYYETVATMINVWLDTMVCTFHFNDTGIKYVRDIISKLAKDKDKDKNEIEIIPVLCRIPWGTKTEGDRDLGDMLNKLGQKDLFKIHSNRETEKDDKLVLGYYEDVQNVQMTEDYLKLFSRLIGWNEQKQGSLKEKIGVPKKPWNQERLFRLETETGAIINPNDESRNVSFKVETFQLLLQGLQEGFANIHQETSIKPKSSTDVPDSATGKWFDDLLFASGKKCGEKFGASLL